MSSKLKMLSWQQEPLVQDNNLNHNLIIFFHLRCYVFTIPFIFFSVAKGATNFIH